VQAVPASPKPGRSALFRAGLRSRTAFWFLFAGVGGALVLAAALHDWRVPAVGSVGTVALVVFVAYSQAGKRAEREFFVALAPALGLTYMGEVALWGVTPLLAAGDRRRFQHVMARPGCQLGLYTYEVRRQRSRNEPARWDPYHFTLCTMDVSPTMPAYPGVYLRRKLGLLHGDDWLRDSRFRRVELESIAFNERYDLLCAPDQDELALRELFSPTLVDWLATHPLEPGFELRGGVLVTWLPGHVEEAGKLDFFLQAAEHLGQAADRGAPEAAATAL
jgi:hypothetical protein